MAQICVVNCYSCETFQGQQVKKGKKWICKMCGEKQSFKKIFAQGSGKECRQVVQKLNMINGNLKRQMLEKGCLQEHIETTRNNEHRNWETCRANQTSKWNQFVSSGTSDDAEVEQLDDNTNGISFTTERETFNKYQTQNRKRPMKAISSDCKIPHLYSRNEESNYKVLPPQNKRSCTNEKLEIQVQSCTTTKVSSRLDPTQVSKWSKYT